MYATTPRQAKSGGQPKRPVGTPPQGFAAEATGIDDRLPAIDKTVKSQECRLGRKLDYADRHVG